MHRIALIAVFTALSAAPSLAQSFEGNWGCRDATSAKAGILTIYGSVYGFASTTMADAASGTGTITGYEDGVAFNDGGLKSARNIVAGRVIADSRDVLTLREANYPPVHYIPRQDVDMAQLQRTDHASYCPYKGDCSYFSLVAGGERGRNAVWSYESPYDAVATIKDHLAFYPDRVDSLVETPTA